MFSPDFTFSRGWALIAIKALKYDASSSDAAYYQISSEHKLIYSTYYLGLTGFVAMMTFEIHSILEAGIN